MPEKTHDLSIISGTLLLIALVCLTACQAPYASGPHYPDPQSSFSSRIGKISRIIGTGEVRINNQIVNEGAVMLSGDHIKTVGDALATLNLANGGEILFDADTDPILELISDAYCKLRILINVGRILVDTTCETQTETGSGAVIDTLKTTFHLTVTSEWTELTVIKGKMTIRSNVGGIQVVPAGYQCLVLRDRPAPAPVRADTWKLIDWACRLDHRLCREHQYSQHNVFVPDIVNTELDQARQTLSWYDLKMGRVRERATDRKFDDGRVAAQSPGQGVQVPAGTEVDLYVWRYRTVSRKMPMLLDLPLRKAKTMLKDAGIRLGRIKTLKTRDQDRDGRVARQAPKAGTRIQPDTETGLTVYRYERRQKPMLKVPRLEGMHIKNVRVELEKAGLKLGRTFTESTRSRSQIGFVFRQKPAAGTYMEPGGTVDVWVFRKGVLRKSFMPMLLELPLRKAKTMLKDAGIRLSRIKTLKTRDQDRDGRVVRQTPKAGTRIQPDTETGLTVYRYERRQKPMLKVPRLEGMHIKNVRVELEKAGLKLGRTFTESTRSRSQIGFVFRQKPIAGTSLAPGTTVDVWVFKKEIPRSPYLKSPVLLPGPVHNSRSNPGSLAWTSRQPD